MRGQSRCGTEGRRGGVTVVRSLSKNPTLRGAQLLLRRRRPSPYRDFVSVVSQSPTPPASFGRDQSGDGADSGGPHPTQHRQTLLGPGASLGGRGLFLVWSPGRGAAGPLPAAPWRGSRSSDATPLSFAVTPSLWDGSSGTPHAPHPPTHPTTRRPHAPMQCPVPARGPGWW